MSVLTRPGITAALADGTLVVDPQPKPEHIGPNSIDLHLADDLLFYGRYDCLDAREAARAPYSARIAENGLTLIPGRLYLGRTVERTFTPKHVPYIGGRSSVGRLGISIHCTAGFGDVGFNGTWTLEISVVVPVRIYPTMRIAQLWLFEISDEVPRNEQYQGRYQGQIEPTVSKFHEGEK